MSNILGAKKIYHISFCFFILFPLIYALVLILGNIHKGLDFTDEGHYLVSALYANEASFQISQFGHYTGLLLKAVGYNLVSFRVLGVLILIFLSSLFVFSLESYWAREMEQELSMHQRVLNFSVANTSVLVYYHSWIPTPSYNWLSLVSCLIVGAGLFSILARSKRTLGEIGITRLPYQEPIIIGFGIMLAFMAKPTTGMALGILTCILVILLSSRKHWFKIISGIGIFTIIFFVLHVLIFEKGFSHFYNDLSSALEFSDTLRNSHTINNFLSNTITALLRIPITAVVYAWLPLVVVIVLGIININPKARSLISTQYLRSLNIILMVTTVITCWLQLLHNGFWMGGQFGGVRNGYSGLIFVIVLILIAWVSKWGISRPLQSWSIHNKASVFVISLLFFPIAYGLGSSGGTIFQSSAAFIFYALAGLWAAYWIEIGLNTKIISTGIAVLLLFTSLMIVKGALDHPYRLNGSIEDQKEPVSFLGNNTKLYVDARTAAYINDIQLFAKSNDWIQGTPLIDMSGTTPMATYILNAKPVGRNWLIGGYKGSDKAAYQALSHVNKAILKKSWVLTAPEGKRTIPLRIFDQLGIDFDAEYIHIGDLTTGFKNKHQKLWRPK